MALALGSLVLTTTVGLLYAFGRTWLHQAEADTFEQHAEGVAFFLRNALNSIAYDTEQEGPPVTWDRPPDFGIFADPLLRFYISEPSSLFYPETRPLTAYIHFHRSYGLSLLWHPTTFDSDEQDEVQVFRTPLSPYARKIIYYYYDAKDDDWEKSMEPLKDRGQRLRHPDFIEITLQADEDDTAYNFGLTLPGELQEQPIP